MDDSVTLRSLSDEELDAVSAGRHGGGGGGGTVVQIVEISIGQIIATGHSTLTVNLAGIGGNGSAVASLPGHGHRRG